MTNKQGKAYRKKGGAVITAVQLNLDCKGFSYRKWGDDQFCKPSDWLVNNQDDCYTIDGETFADTYTRVSEGVYQKTSVVWAEVAAEAGSVDTREGSTAFCAGDYIVWNKPDGSDTYAVSKARFEASYEPVAG